MSGVVIISFGGEGAGRYAECLHFGAARLKSALPLGAAAIFDCGTPWRCFHGFLSATKSN